MMALDRRLRCFARSALLAGCAASGAAAQTFTVDSVLDQIDDDLVDIGCHTAAGTCTLRAAVMQASVNPGDTTILLPAGTYLMTRLPSGANGPDSGDLNLVKTGDDTITIQGAGAQSTIIDGNDLDRIFLVADPTQALISDVTIRNGTAQFGGGIRVEGGLSLFGSRVVDNVATANGGGIFFATLLDSQIAFSDIAENHAGGGGGGVYVETGSSSLFFIESSIRANQAENHGGGICFLGPDYLILDHSTVSGSSARVHGGILVSDPGATAELFDSSVYDNQATDSELGEGGGISNYGTLYVTNSTISGNRATVDGGGLHNTGTTWLYSSTIVFNEADTDADPNGGLGGGVFNEPGSAFAVRNSVLAGNTRSGAPVPTDCAGSLDAYGHNRFGSFSGCTVTHTGACGGADLLLGSVAELGPLQFNGGATPTHAIQAGSGLIDDVDSPCNCQDRYGFPLINDQRDGPRVVGARCDVGAFEVGALPVGALFSDGFESGNFWNWR
jgi:hypothetical protein